MIKKVVIKGFKRFQDTTFEFPGHVVIAGPNNTGKTTALQAIAAWSFSYNQWKTLNNFNPRNGYERKPIARQAFSSVPLRTYDLLWRDRNYRDSIEIEVVAEAGWSLAMEFIPDSTEQIYVHPKANVPANVARDTNLNVVFVPAMTGLSKQEPWYHVQATIDDLLGQAKPGDVLRNLLVQARQTQTAWDALQESIHRLFGFELIPPDTSGPYIIAEYKRRGGGPTFDIASAGSGFQQVLMLLTFLNTRPSSVLLLDEPDAHLHWILQDAILGELHTVAARQRSQLIVATHSEEIINSAEPDSLCVLFDTPRMLGSTIDRNRLLNALKLVSNTDIMNSLQAKGVLFTEDYTDLEILKAWAVKLNHRFATILPHDILLKKMGGSDFQRARQFYEAITLVRDIPGLVLLDRDARREIESQPITGKGLQRVRWARYEIENYLLHPEVLKRYVSKLVGEGGAADPYLRDLEKYLQENYPPAFFKDPFSNNPAWSETKARENLIPPLLSAAGIHNVPHTKYFEIAALMQPNEIHPEVTEKLDAIIQALGL